MTTALSLTCICAAGLILGAALPKFRRQPAAEGVFRFFEEEDDSDIKIAGAPKPETDEALEEANELEAQRSCGNLDKAHALGVELARKVISEDGEADLGQDGDEGEILRTQRRLLLAFSVISTVAERIKSNVLKGVVLKVFYDSLQQSLPDLYKDINSSGSFSFYTLCARRGGNVENCIGSTFAMLAGKEGDAVLEEFGKALYLRFVDITNKTIDSYNLKQ